MTSSVEIILVNWNGRDDTLRALQSLSAQASAAGTVVTVVDNGSTDGSVDAVLRRFPDTRVLQLKSNTGFTGGIAHGVSASRADHLVFLNNDTVVEPGWLESLSQAMEAAPHDVIAVGGKIVDSTATLVDFVGGVITFDGHALQSGFRKGLEEVREPEAGAELLFACGGNMIVRRQPFVALGGFDPDYFAYLEDVDFGWRAWLSGSRVLYDPRAMVRHKSGATSDRLGNYERGVLFERNALQTAMKNYDDDSLQRFSGPIFLTMLHRLHHYVSSRNDNVESLLAPPFGEANGAKPGKKAVLDDGLTAMQFRAMHWFFANQERLMKKRAMVQRLRKRADREIFDRFPVYYVPTYPGDTSLMQSALFRLLQPSVRSSEKRLDEIIRQ
jgi:GT2 family glycosyltransferase